MEKYRKKIHKVFFCHMSLRGYLGELRPVRAGSVLGSTQPTSGHVTKKGRCVILKNFPEAYMVAQSLGSWLPLFYL